MFDELFIYLFIFFPWALLVKMLNKEPCEIFTVVKVTTSLCLLTKHYFLVSFVDHYASTSSQLEVRKRTAFSKEEKLFSYEKSIYCIMRHCWIHDWKVFTVRTVKLIACEGKSDNFNFYSQYLTRVFEVPLPWVFSACYPCGRNGVICKKKKRGRDEKQTRRERVRQRLITCRELRSPNAGAKQTLYIWNRANCSI